MKSVHSLFRLGLIALASCLVWPAVASANTAPIRVVATFSILADMVREVGGDLVQVTSLVGPDADAHVFKPSPADARALAQADLVVMNGLGYEGWMDRLIRSSGYKGKPVVATRGIKPLKASDKGHGHGHGHSHGHDDPHAWQDIANARIYVVNIRDALLAKRPENAPDIQARADGYIKRIEALDRDARARLADVPAAERRVIVAHSAFEYFARAYGVTFLSAHGWTTEQEPSASTVAALIREVRNKKVRAVFLENLADPRLMQRIAQESGARLGGTLYSDALSRPGTQADTYLKMMAHNVDALVSALK